MLKNKLIIYSTASSLFQAVSAFVLVVTVSHFVPSIEYVKYSRFMFYNQLLVIIFFEWLRIAALRNVNDLRKSHEGRDLSLISMAYFACCMGLIIYCIVDYFISHNSILYELAIIAAVAAQGFGDISLVMLRFGGRLLDFSKLQVYRNLLLMALVVAAALVTRLAIYASLAVVVSNLAFLAILAAYKTRAFVWGVHRIDARISVPFVKFGVYAAAASVLHGMVTAIVRAHTLHLITDQARAAAFSAAFDLLQKPFPLVFAIVATAVMPEMYRLFDEGMVENRAKIIKIMGLIVSSQAATFILVVAGFYMIAPIFFGRFVGVGITDFALPIAGYFLALVMAQSVTAQVPHMMKLSFICLVSAGVHLALTECVVLMKLGGVLTMLNIQVVIIAGVIAGNLLVSVVLLTKKARSMQQTVTLNV